jgi:hypothetical protein
LDKAPPGDNQSNYPTANPQYGYNYESPTHKILVMFQDGHHGPDRWNLTDNQTAPPQNPNHEHDDWKRSPPEILDQDPSAAKTGYLAHFRVPDGRLVYEQPGDEMGLSPAERARTSKDRLDDGI